MPHIPGTFQVSDDFCNDLYEEIFVKVRNAFATASHPVVPGSTGVADVWTEFSGGWNAVKVRFEACTEYSITFTQLVNTIGVNPLTPDRFTQDHELFVFFFTGLSAIESYCYALFALGSLLSPADFPMATENNLKNINPKATGEKFKRCYKDDAISNNLKAILSSSDYKDWAKIRNTLAHRTAPGRFVYDGGPNVGASQLTLGISIDANTASLRREWLLQTLNFLLADTKTFVNAHIP